MPRQRQKRPNFPTLSTTVELLGPWGLRFDPKWGGPESAVFDTLTDWTKRPEPGIRFYSGTATYRKTFNLPGTLERVGTPIFLDLGDLKDLAEVRLNGEDLGVLWARPFRVDITETLKPADNLLEIDIVNVWTNRLIGDAALSPEKRFTRTNIAGAHQAE